MLISLTHICGYKLLAQDGEIGKIKDFYFDDLTWVVRYLIADTGKWLPGRQVLISRDSLVQPEWSSKLFTVTLNTDQIEKSPPIDTNKPVSRQMETQLHDFYSIPYYWGARAADFNAPGVAAATVLAERKRQINSEGKEGDSHLRSLNEVTGYHIKATDDDIGHAEDFIVSTADWMIQYMVVDTRNWLPGKKVLLALDWVDVINWDSNTVRIGLSRQAVQDSPQFDPATPINREYENRLYDYYGRPKYW